MPQYISARIFKWLSAISFYMLILVLLAGTIWFGFFTDRPGAPLHNQDGMAPEMVMGASIKVLDANGKAVATAQVQNGNEHSETDENGVVYFDHLMMHDNKISVVYQDEHYLPSVHVHGTDNLVILGSSLEFNHRISLGFGGSLVLVLLLSVIRQIRQSRKKALHFFRMGRIARVMQLFGAAGLLASLIAITAAPANVSTTQAAVLSTLAVPKNLKIEQDNRNAILTWDGGPITPGGSYPAGVTGYKVSWGPAATPTANVQLTSYRIIQLQPVVNSQPYQATVQSVDNLGNLSAPSTVIQFTGSSARVDALRSRMTGFFDDFNRQPGATDELKWNVAYSTCNETKYNAFFINNQTHVHSMLGSKLNPYCDRGQTVSRARSVFDFTNRTGTIAFDFDGSTRRGIWYLDLVPATQLTDITGQINAFAGSRGNPGNMLRIRQNDASLDIEKVDASGLETSLASTNWNPYPPLDWAGLPVVNNVRRHWEIKISASATEVVINGKTVLKANVQPGFTKAYVLWNQFGYNTPKQNEPFVLTHWGNFGFDGAASPVETHNYRTPGYGGSDAANASGFAPIARQINIPDQLTGVTAQRLMFTLQMVGFQAYAYSPNDRVVVNGKTFNMPKPTGPYPGANLENLVSSFSPYSMVINLPAGTLITGQNTVNFLCNSCGVTNVHAELDFNKGSAPVYTPPDKVYSLATTPVMPDIGPGATIDTVGTYQTWQGMTYSTAIKGKVNLHLLATNDIAMQVIGKNPGIQRVELWVDKKVVWSQVTNGTPAFDYTYALDTTKFTNGKHEIYFIAYNPNGTVSTPDYFEMFGTPGMYYPVYVTIKN